MSEPMDAWATKLAAAVAPDEVDLAPAIVEAFAEGGAARADLLRSVRVAGGFDALSAGVVLPVVLGALSAASSAVLSALGAPLLSKFVDCVKSGLTVAELGLKGQRLISAAAVPATEPYEPLRLLMEVLPTHLQASGIPQEQAEIATLRTLRVLLEDPHSARLFVSRLSEKR